MERYSWPGNVRELQNVLDRFWAFGEMALETPEAYRSAAPRQALAGPRETRPPEADEARLSLAREELEIQRIRSALEHCGWKKGKSAEMLGVTIRTLQRKIKRYGIAP